jgi:hypothetical protein
MSSPVGNVNVQDNRHELATIENLGRYVRNGQMIAAAVPVSSVALLLLGVIAMGRGSFIAGVPLFILSVPCCYLSYNGYRVCSNAKELIDRVVNTIKTDEPSQKIDKETLKKAFSNEKIKRDLLKGTVCFGWFIDGKSGT